MKRTLFILALISVLSVIKVNGQTLETQLRNFPIATYLNQPIDTLIAHLPAGYDTAIKISSAGNLNSGASLQINYPNYQFWVDIDITDPQFITVKQNFASGPPHVLWPFSLLRKEKVGRVRIFTGAYVIINEDDVF